MRKSLTTLLFLAAATFTFAVGCEDNRTPGQKVEDAVDVGVNRVEDAGDATRDAIDDAGDATRDAVEDAGDSIEDATR